MVDPGPQGSAIVDGECARANEAAASPDAKNIAICNCIARSIERLAHNVRAAAEGDIGQSRERARIVQIAPAHIERAGDSQRCTSVVVKSGTTRARECGRLASGDGKCAAAVVFKVGAADVERGAVINVDGAGIVNLTNNGAATTATCCRGRFEEAGS